MCSPSVSSDAKKDSNPNVVPHNYTVVYDSEIHWSVLTQRTGSVWSQVFPYCVVNVLLMLALRMLHTYGGEAGATLTGLYAMGKVGYKFMKFIMAFLFVSRVKMSLDQYNEARTNIGKLYKESRELIQNAVVFTEDQTNEAAKEWRQEMAYRTLLLLRTAMATLNFTVRKEAAWMLPELNGKEKEIMKRNLLINLENQHYAIEENTEFEETMHVPVLVAYMLSETIISQGKRLKNPLQLARESKLYSSADSFMEGYYGLRKFLTTPVPFPLLQISRTFIFLYTFSIPFELLSDESCLAAHCFFVFLVTYGFIGLETVAMELDNPFGDDPNDFNNLGLARSANEDTYLAVFDIDGRAWADSLRRRMRGHEKSAQFTETRFLLNGDVNNV